MDVLVTKTQESLKLYHDLFGNVFAYYGEKVYYLTIDADNAPELFPVKKDRLTDLSEYEIDHARGKIHSGVPSLKGAVEDDISKRMKNEEYDEEVILETEYFPEKKYFYTEGGEIENHYASITDMDPVFKFFGDEELTTDLGFESNSLYNLLIVKGNSKSKEIVFMSEEYNNTCAYRLTVYTDGVIKCNVVGESETMYNIVKEGEDVVICRQ